MKMAVHTIQDETSASPHREVWKGPVNVGISKGKAERNKDTAICCDTYCYLSFLSCLSKHRMTSPYQLSGLLNKQAGWTFSWGFKHKEVISTWISYNSHLNSWLLLL